MFMAKGELKNAGRLTQIKLGNAKTGIVLYLAFIMGIIFITNLIPTIVGLLGGANGIKTYQWTDYSLWFTFAVLVGIIIMQCTYRESNHNFAVYPQTNISRYLSSQALFHFWIIFVPLLCLVLYLIQYGIIAIIAAGRSDIHFVYNFDIVFLLAGLAALIIYSSIISGIISLISALIRRFRLYAAIFSAVLAGLALANLPVTFKVFKVLFSFLIFEHRVGLFILKGIILWAVLFVISFIVNKYTVYYRDALKFSKGVAAGIVAVLTLVILAGGAVLSILPSTETRVIVENNVQDEYTPRPVWRQIEIDTFGLPKGSRLDIKTQGDIAIIRNADKLISSGSQNEKLFWLYEDGTKIEYPKGYLALELDSQLSDLNGNKLIIDYMLPFRVVSSQEISSLTKPEFNAWLDGQTLNLSYTYEKNIKVVFAPIWSFMWQFDYFKGKNFFNESFGNIYSEGHGGIFINIE